MRRSRHGLTLFETILALALTTVVLGMLGGAVRLQMQMLDTRRTGIEQASVARAVMGYLRRDLQSVVRITAEEGAATSASSGDSLDLGDEGGTGEGGTGEEDTGEVDDATATDTESFLLQGAPGLYGTAYELRVDVTRFPNPRAWEAIQAGQVVQSSVPLSGLQTVRYFLAGSGTSDGVVGSESVQAANSVGMNADNTSDSGTGLASGLARQAVDYGAASWAVESGSASGLDRFAELLAPEVIALEFRYFDGIEWLLEWDSEQLGTLPVAIEITLLLADTRDGSTTATNEVNAFMAMSGELVFSTVVRLPVAELPDEEEETEL